jgi:putative DNA primase/helicase
MYSCNDIPRNYGERNDAFYRRLIIIKFNKEVPPHKKDLELIDKLKDEADGILAWSIIGLKRLIKNQYQFNETDRTLAELNAYKLKNNNVLAFIAEACVVEVGAIASRSEMFDSYRAFCRDGGHGSIAPEHDFNEDVCNFDSTIKMENERVTRKRLFRGIRLA